MSLSTLAPLGFIRPEIPRLVPEPPSGEGWIHEIKHDGYRTLIVIDSGKVRAFSRHGRDWTGPYRRVVEAAAKLTCKTALLDGELIVQDENGIADFDALRSAIYTAPHRLVFFAFDLLHHDGWDLRRTPLLERRAALRKLIRAVRCSSAIMSRPRVPHSSGRQPNSGLKASSPSGRPASTALDAPRTGSRPRTWSKGNSSFWAPSLMTAPSLGHCWRGNGRVDWSLQAGNPPGSITCES
jgi:hypothetical protein